MVRAFVASRKDPYVSQAYKGDLKGNVWRFDLSTDRHWKAEKIAALTDKNGKAQPITAGIRIEIDQNNGNRYLSSAPANCLANWTWCDDGLEYDVRDQGRRCGGARSEACYALFAHQHRPQRAVAGRRNDLTGFAGTLAAAGIRCGGRGLVYRQRSIRGPADGVRICETGDRSLRATAFGNFVARITSGNSVLQAPFLDGHRQR
jgi:hypothetical protein